ncbi:MAG: lmo0937 family membrane protein [Patescibacteria group bacterium]|nr:lmo0937 family membrane protein [Patescibacteria group bacterium]
MGLLEWIAVILIIAWLGGFILHIAGGLIHILLVLAIILFLVRFIRRQTV